MEPTQRHQGLFLVLGATAVSAMVWAGLDLILTPDAQMARAWPWRIAAPLAVTGLPLALAAVWLASPLAPRGWRSGVAVGWGATAVAIAGVGALAMLESPTPSEPTSWQAYSLQFTGTRAFWFRLGSAPARAVLATWELWPWLGLWTLLAIRPGPPAATRLSGVAAAVASVALIGVGDMMDVNAALVVTFPFIAATCGLGLLMLHLPFLLNWVQWWILCGWAPALVALAMLPPAGPTSRARQALEFALGLIALAAHRLVPVIGLFALATDLAGVGPGPAVLGSLLTSWEILGLVIAWLVWGGYDPAKSRSESS